MTLYRKPPTISPGLIFFRKRFLMGLHRGGGLISRGDYIWRFMVCMVFMIFSVYSLSQINKKITHYRIDVDKIYLF